MIGLSLKGFFFALVLAAASVANVKSADALTYGSILGKWWKAKTNPNWVNLMITREALTITHLGNNGVNRLNIDHLEFTDTTVVIHYLAAGDLKGVPGTNPYRVSYGNFSSDGKTMVQLSNSVQPRDAYYTRC